jgi:hypothetical protein
MAMKNALTSRKKRAAPAEAPVVARPIGRVAQRVEGNNKPALVDGNGITKTMKFCRTIKKFSALKFVILSICSQIFFPIF